MSEPLTLFGHPARLTVDVHGEEVDVSAAVGGDGRYPGALLIDGAVVADLIRHTEFRTAPPPQRVVSIRLPEELDEWARAEAHRRGVTVSDLVRRALREQIG